MKLFKALIAEKEYILSKQILRSATSIGANVREAQNAVSKKDFKHKLSISQKEADETLYWLELLERTDYLTEGEFNKLHNNASELIRIIRTIILNTKDDVK
jgi:four helix bundle protein